MKPLLLRSLVAIAALAAAAAPPAAAQATAGDRAYLSVDGSLQVPSSFNGVAHPIEFAEPATIETSYHVKAAPGIDAGAGVRVWRSLAVGAEVSYFTKSSGASIAAQMPHPFFLSRPRAVSGDAGGLRRAETSLHVRVAWTVPAGSRWKVGFFGGPSLIAIKQDLVNDVALTQSYPFDAASYGSSVTERRSKSKVGFNVGTDVSYLVKRRVGLGLAASFSRARVPLTVSAGDTVKVDAGGGRVGGGLRVVF